MNTNMLQNCFYNFRDEEFKQVKSNDAHHEDSSSFKSTQWQRFYEINS